MEQSSPRAAWMEFRGCGIRCLPLMSKSLYGKPRKNLVPDLPVIAIALSPDGQLLATIDIDATIRAWSTKSDEPEFIQTPSKSERQYYNQAVPTLAFSSTGSQLAVWTKGAAIRIWDTRGWNRRNSPTSNAKSLPVNTDVIALAFSHDGSRLAVSSTDGRVTIWNISSAEVALFRSGHKAPIVAMAFTPDDNQLATVGADGIDSCSHNKLSATQGRG